MKLNKVEKEKNIVSLEVQVGAEEFNAACNTAYKRNVGKINVPGFRKGKAPRKMIEKMYGEGVFFEDAVNIAYPKAYREAVEEADIEPIDQADVEITDLNKDGFTFVAKVQVPPEVTVKEYKGLTAPKLPVEVKDEDVAAELKRLQDRNSSIATVERPAKDGDTVNLDFEGSVDGVPFEGGKGEKYDLVLGSGSFIPGFEEQLVGASAGEEKEIGVTFPEEYHAEELKGKPAVFKCKINEVKETILPELDDEFAKDVTDDCETLDQLKKKITDSIAENRKRTSDGQFEEELLDKLVAEDNMEAEVPDVMVQSQLDHIMEDLSMRMQMQGLNLETYLQMTGMNFESMRDTYKDQALRQVKISLALAKVAELEGVDITDEDVEKEYARMSEEYKMPLERVKAAVSPRGVKQDLRTSRALAAVKDSAVATAPEASEEAPKKKTVKKSAKKAEAEDGEKKPAKKPAAKKAVKKEEKPEDAE